MPTSREERQEELVEAYLSATGLTSIFIVLSDDRESVRPVIGDARAAAKILAGLLDKGSCSTELWFSNSAVAARVFAAVQGPWADARRQPDGWIACSEAEARARLYDAIRKSGAKPLGADEVATQCEEAVKAVIAEAERMRRDGELKLMNEAYKKYRTTFRPSESRPKPDDYHDWLHRVHLRVATSAGSKIRQRLRFSTD
jgi:hypothetical protein